MTMTMEDEQGSMEGPGGGDYVLERLLERLLGSVSLLSQRQHGRGAAYM